MINLKTVHLVTQFEQGFFYLRAMDANGAPLPFDSWTRLLFGGHAESFYGTKLTIGQQDGEPAVRLTPFEWASLFKAEHFNRFARFEWDEAGHFSLACAPILYEAVFDVMPSFQEDGVQWTVPEEVYDEFAESFWREPIYGESRQSFVERIFPDLASEAHPNITAVTDAVGTRLTMDELNRYFDAERLKEYLADGEPAAFEPGLRLSEPQSDDGSWTLEMILLRRKPSEKVYELNKKLPKSAEPFLEAAQEELRRWLRLFPELDDEGELKHFLSEEEAITFLTDRGEKLTALGIPVLLPPWWESVRSAAVSVAADVRDSNKQSFVGMNAILDFDFKVALGGAEMTEEEFLALAEAGSRLVKANGRWVHLDPDVIRKIKTLMERAKQEGLTVVDVLNQEFADPDDAARVHIRLNRSLQAMVDRLKSGADIPLLSPPKKLHGELRPYQLAGMSWLLFLRECGFGACLADDMGLGKTVQLISYLLHVEKRERPETPALIICPTSVLGNWQRELDAFAPDLSVMLYYGKDRPRGEAFSESIANADVVLTTYGLVHSDFDTLEKIEWNTVALDEAQNIKNAGTKQSRAVRKLRSRHAIALTGTPMENRLSELWTIFDFTNRGWLGTLAQFQKTYMAPIEKEHDAGRVAALQAKIRPFLLRRTKTDPEAALGLPDKVEQKEYCPLSKEQAVLYEQAVRETMDQIGQLTAFERRGLILRLLNQLKQLCSHPALYLKEDDPKDVQERASKMEKLMELAGNIHEQGEACLIFTQYIGMGEMIQRELSGAFGIHVPFLNGATPKQERDKLVTQFQNGEFPFFLLSLKAGGTGLNLTAANHVIHYDRWWNPAVENQATDRAYRIGQSRFVHVHKFITTGTIEEKIDAMIESKQAASSEIIQSGAFIASMTDRELAELFTLDKNPALR
ncbi:DEAD/DEAH box helicase [Domibacillus sp. PGB-M46]|uniref:DEAD/DEAH box helicase n=1 Tax=Domibacillus sp. PGB-M46 TaxID=2910255 RepID=UPI001F58492A|nr:DEAD/DEAH box helicase [Domibacillus sp. PGB-M46]MCI2253859.1 DEAD/DEAH box helicase [Domibacillus sp. PGB-M46]